MNTKDTKSIHIDLKTLKEDFKQLVREIADKTYESLSAQQEAKRTTLFQFIEYYSNLIDELILSHEKQEKLNYQAGYVILQALDKNKMQLHLDLYYQNEQGSWINKQQSSHVMEMVIYLNDEAVIELNTQKEIKYPIEKPGDKL